MKNYGFVFWSIIVIGVTFSCKNPGDRKFETPGPDTNIPIAVPPGFTDLGIDTFMIKELVLNADHIDYIFHDLPLAMNQDGKNSIYQEMRFVSKEPALGIPYGCEPLARKIFIGQGEIILEADLYFTDQCLFQIYIKDEKKLYGNYLSPEGIAFYRNVMEQAQQSMPENVRNEYVIPQGN